MLYWLQANVQATYTISMELIQSLLKKYKNRHYELHKRVKYSEKWKHFYLLIAFTDTRVLFSIMVLLRLSMPSQRPRRTKNIA